MKVSSGIYALLSDKIHTAWIGTKLASGMETIHRGELWGTRESGADEEGASEGALGWKPSWRREDFIILKVQEVQRRHPKTLENI